MRICPACGNMVAATLRCCPRCTGPLPEPRTGYGGPPGYSGEPAIGDGFAGGAPETGRFPAWPAPEPGAVPEEDTQSRLLYSPPGRRHRAPRHRDLSDRGRRGGHRELHQRAADGPGRGRHHLHVVGHHPVLAETGRHAANRQPAPGLPRLSPLLPLTEGLINRLACWAPPSPVRPAAVPRQARRRAERSSRGR